ncbi:DUF3089 domain-containing protein [Erythrobacteraceae bacterium CFH 75059]|uniref:DUF3089 domain-containing protein n=1 Tax=Qipengyuania thermophila TaxID=2509361 RepID=UPI00102116F5|nr:DUF3089 domain-containing protein [Qipengyuania thermophila]TCD04935.1 DUF3089 domain-containing protein [Erythrobacteraceae bacterium CFH 75059]
MARKFLYVVAFLIVLAIGTLIVLRLFSSELTRLAFVPTRQFEPQAALAPNAYADPALWLARPGLQGPNPVLFRPRLENAPDGGDGRVAPPTPVRAAVFFVHPTSFVARSQWNAPLDDPESQELARTYLRGMASPFAGATQVWAPRYRQATVGAFLARSPDADAAIDAAYQDVAQAFAQFLQDVPADLPIVLAGHSQGALHILRLLNETVGDDLRRRLAVAYIIGWPVSADRDLPSLGLPACAQPDQRGCIVSWSSFAEPADPSALLGTYAASLGFDGQARGDSPIVCTNPLTGRSGGEAPAAANLGTLKPEENNGDAVLVPGAVPARCDRRGLLLIGAPPRMGSAVLPGNNYHVYDIPLFWANLRADFARRLAGAAS